MITRLKSFLDARNVSYRFIEHSPTYKAIDTAMATHVQGKELAKVVIVRIDGVLCMAVVPATHWVDTEKMALLTGADYVQIAEEDEFDARFPDSERGAMPPFGNLYRMPVYVAAELAEDNLIVFNAGSHTRAVQMSYKDFERLVAPVVADISRPREAIWG